MEAQHHLIHTWTTKPHVCGCGCRATHRARPTAAAIAGKDCQSPMQASTDSNSCQPPAPAALKPWAQTGPTQVGSVALWQPPPVCALSVQPHLSWGPGRRAQMPCSSPLPGRFGALLLQACLPLAWWAQTFLALAGWACSWLAPGQEAWCCCCLLQEVPRLHLRLHAPRQRTRCPGRSQTCLRVGQQQQQMETRRRRKGWCRAAKCGCHTHPCGPFAISRAQAR